MTKTPSRYATAQPACNPAGDDSDFDAFLTPEQASGSPSSSYFEDILTASEAAARLRIHPKTLQKLAREGRVPSIRMGKYWRFRLSALDQWVSSHENQSSQPFRVE